MGKKVDFIKKFETLLVNPSNLEEFLSKNSNLPSPRSNLELGFALSEIFDNSEILLEWTKITETEADVNHPRSFLVFCSLLCLGRMYTKKKDPEIISILKKMIFIKMINADPYSIQDNNLKNSAIVILHNLDYFA